MITQLKIENYKSIQDLTLDVGRVNVLIGENGCGKSNILEAITLAGAAEADRLAKEFLLNRGIRVTEPKLMRSAFNLASCEKIISINIRLDNIRRSYILKNDNSPYSEWIFENDLNEVISEAKKLYESSLEIEKKIKEFTSIKKEIIDSFYAKKEESKNIIDRTTKIKIKLQDIISFIIYSPENTSLRNLEKEGGIQPLGVNGEGLLKLLTVIQHEAQDSEIDKEAFSDIQETLELFDWYESVEIPNELSPLERKITIKDRYLEMPFDQRSANEGFLLVLFYITLVVSKYTPKIFAIDNIDTSLNPKLCTKLIKELTRLAKKYDKQIFLTSHNPAVLDGINLADDEQRLIVVYRDDEGKTCCDRIGLKDKPKSSARDRIARLIPDNEPHTKEEILNRFDNSEEPLKLSEAFLRGYLGGLSTGF